MGQEVPPFQRRVADIGSRSEMLRIDIVDQFRKYPKWRSDHIAARVILNPALNPELFIQCGEIFQLGLPAG